MLKYFLLQYACNSMPLLFVVLVAPVLGFVFDMEQLRCLVKNVVYVYFRVVFPKPINFANYNFIIFWKQKIVWLSDFRDMHDF